MRPEPRHYRLLAQAAEAGGSPADSHYWQSEWFVLNGDLFGAIDQLKLWATGHPDGLIITYEKVWQPALVTGATPLYEQPYEDTQLRIWPVVALKGG